MVPAVSGNKAASRVHFRRLRQQRLPAMEAELQQQAAQCLPALLEAGGCLGLYWPLPGEADLRMLAQQPALAERLALPRVAQGRLGYRRWRHGEPLQADETRIPAPAQGPELEASALALLLVPALALDQRGIRLGYGGGWFDRLRSDPIWGTVPALAVLPADCVVQTLPSDLWDVPLHGWLDEHGVHWLQAV
jgi:5-formyltetrahydrofolate cyclo-ligase